MEHCGLEQWDRGLPIVGIMALHTAPPTDVGYTPWQIYPVLAKICLPSQGQETVGMVMSAGGISCILVVEIAKVWRWQWL